MDRFPLKMKGFLAAYAKCGRIGRASKAHKMSRFTHHTWMAKYPEYRVMFAKAHEVAMSRLEDVAQGLATYGEEEIVTNNGEVVFIWRDVDGTIVPAGDKAAVHREPLIRRKIVPSLLIFKLKGEFPEKYRDRQQLDHTTGGEKLNVEVNYRNRVNSVANDTN